VTKTFISTREPGTAPTAVSSCTCPMCHTVDAAMTANALASGGYWLCIRCGQEWDANRLATRAAYTEYAERTRGLAFAGVA
jgi:transposase